MAAAIGAVLVTATWWAASQRVRVPPEQRDPVPILIVDFENRANDPAFTGALERALSIGKLGLGNALNESTGQAKTLAQDDNVLVTSACLAVASGRLDEARAIARELAAQLPPRSRAYGKVIEAELLMASKQYVPAIDALNDAKELANLWLVRYTLGHAYFQLGDYQAAMSEFEECVRRRGEATSLFLDDLPTFRYYAPVPYWLGRARDMRELDPSTQYQEYLAIRGGAANDPLVVDAQRRLAQRVKLP